MITEELKKKIVEYCEKNPDTKMVDIVKHFGVTLREAGEAYMSWLISH